MELRKFVTESLYQIVWGINDAQEEFADSECEVKFMKNNPSKNSVEKVEEYHDINFNVAVMADEQQSEPPYSRIIVMGLTHLGTGSYEQLLLLVSRLEFTVPVSFVPSTKKKNSKLKAQHHLHYHTNH